MICSCLEVLTGMSMSLLPFTKFELTRGPDQTLLGRTIKLWDLRTMRSRDTLTGHTDAVYCLYYHNNRLISGGEDRTARVRVPTSRC